MLQMLGIPSLSRAMLSFAVQRVNSARASRWSDTVRLVLQVLVSHDFRLISQVAHEIYEVNKVRGLVPVAGIEIWLPSSKLT